MPATATDRIDGLTTSVAVKAPVKAVSTSNLTLSGEQTVNGVAVVEGNRVLVKDQTDPVDNGIYEVSTGNWERARDFDGNRDIVVGTRVFWAGGDGWWRVVGAGTYLEIGVDDITFAVSDTPPYLTVSQFEAVGDGVTNDTAAYQAACDAIVTSGVKKLIFDVEEILVYPTGTLVAGSQTANQFEDLDGVELDGNGCTITVGDTFASGEILYHFAFDNCRQVRVHDFNPEQTVAARSATWQSGQCLVYANNGSKGIEVKRINQVGGIGTFFAVRDTTLADPTQKVSHIEIEDVTCYRVGYPVNGQNSGDWCSIKRLVTNECYRSVFFYGVHNLDVDCEVNNPSVSPGVLLYAGYGLDANSAYLTNVKIKVRSNKLEDITADTTTQGNLVGIGLNYYAARGTPCVVRKIDIDISADYVDDAGLALYSMMTISKIAEAGSADATDRGHIVEGVTISGNIGNADKAGGHGSCINLFSTGMGTWGAGEFVRNIVFKDLVVTGTGSDTHIDVGVGSIVDHVVFDNVVMPTAPAFTGTTQLGTIYKNSVFGGVVYDRIHSVQTLTGAGAVDLTHRTTHIVSTGANALTLAAGIQNKEKIITMVTDGGDATLTVTNGGGFTTLTFADVYDTVVLEYLNSKWVIKSNVGVAVA